MNMDSLLSYRWSEITAFILLLSVSLSTNAATYSTPTSSELLLLPPYCQAKLDGPHHPDLVARWKDMPLFISMHHYCIGLNFLNRAYGSVGYEQRSNSAFARDSFTYCIRNWPETHPLMPEIYLNLGKAMQLGGSAVEGVKYYYKALSLNPRLRDAYLELADFYAFNNQRVEGLKVVTEGLHYLPGEKVLQRRYIELGGKQPYPKPLEQPTAKGEDGTNHKQVDDKSVQDSSVTEKKGSTSPDETAPEVLPSGAEDSTPPEQDVQPKIGSKTNPWCRFCPPE